jgi:hypothetical protein
MKATYALTVLAFAGALSLILVHNVRNQPFSNGNQASSAAFQDGLYLGTLAARRAETPHVSDSRWATAGDRQLFSEGYTKGYEQTLSQAAKQKSAPAPDETADGGDLDDQ